MTNEVLGKQVSERLDDNLQRLKQSLLLWEDVRQIADDVESWANSCLTELHESLNNLNDSHKLAARLSALQVKIFSMRSCLTFQLK